LRPHPRPAARSLRQARRRRRRRSDLALWRAPGNKPVELSLTIRRSDAASPRAHAVRRDARIHKFPARCQAPVRCRAAEWIATSPSAPIGYGRACHQAPPWYVGRAWIARHGAPHEILQIRQNVRVGVFLDQQGCRGVTDETGQQAIAYLLAFHEGRNLGCDIVEAGPLGPYLERVESLSHFAVLRRYTYNAPAPPCFRCASRISATIPASAGSFNQRGTAV